MSILPSAATAAGGGLPAPRRSRDLTGQMP
ncbi:hypothetical protein JOF41_003180 [Saccharothrix coeruleofusca]|nr:hypothetical protein [Saccharothrix coeruleofusca]